MNPENIKTKSKRKEFDIQKLLKRVCFRMRRKKANWLIRNQRFRIKSRRLFLMGEPHKKKQILIKTF